MSDDVTERAEGAAIPPNVQSALDSTRPMTPSRTQRLADAVRSTGPDQTERAGAFARLDKAQEAHVCDQKPTFATLFDDIRATPEYWVARVDELEGVIVELKDSIAELERCERVKAEGYRLEAERLVAYAAKLEAGYPEGLTPTDVANLRTANEGFAGEVERLKGEGDALRDALGLILNTNRSEAWSIAKEALAAGGKA